METGTLTVPGAGIHYEVRGVGPVLLFIHGSGGDAGLFAPLADLLADRYTVVTYDRRAHSRSRVTGRMGEQRVAEHADDARLLLDAMGDEPAFVFATHSGALIGLDLLARSPARVRSMVVHEPPVAELLPDAERWHAMFREVYEIYRRDGMEPAVRWMSAEIGASGPPEPSAGLPAPVLEMLARIRANVEMSLAYEIRSFVRFRPELDLLRDAPLVVAGGAEARESFPYRAGAALAERLGGRVVEFPGDHVGYATHPAEFAAVLRGVLET